MISFDLIIRQFCISQKATDRRALSFSEVTNPHPTDAVRAHSRPVVSMAIPHPPSRRYAVDKLIMTNTLGNDEQLISGQRALSTRDCEENTGNNVGWKQAASEVFTSAKRRLRNKIPRCFHLIWLSLKEIPTGWGKRSEGAQAGIQIQELDGCVRHSHSQFDYESKPDMRHRKRHSPDLIHMLQIVLRLVASFLGFCCFATFVCRFN